MKLLNKITFSFLFFFSVTVAFAQSSVSGKISDEMSFGYILKNFLNNDPRNAISFAAVLLLFGALATLFIKSKETKINLN